MTRTRGLVRLFGLALAGLALSGCISLLPKTKPAQLYRFGARTAASAGSPPPANAVGVYWATGAFQRESAGDRIMTVTGDKVAYVADTRWAAPAQVMFQEAVEAAFEAQPGHVRLVPRGLPAPTDEVLRLDVRNFETRYDRGPRAAPTVLLRVHAIIARDRERTMLSEQLFEARAPASENHVAAIVAAYDTATQDVLSQLIAWTNAKTAPAA